MDPERSERLKELQEKLDNNISDDEKVELLSLMIEDENTRGEARELCYRWLNDDSSKVRIRLILAKSFYLDRYAEFCAAQLKTIGFYAKSPSVQRLEEIVSQGAPGVGESDFQENERDEDETIAEIDLETEFDEVLVDITDE